MSQGRQGNGLGAEDLRVSKGGVREMKLDQRSIPAANRWVSFEPALDPADLGLFLGLEISADYAYRGIHWVVMGAETGPGARLMDLNWARSVKDQCRTAGVPFWMKSAGRGVEMPRDLLIRERPKEELRKMIQDQGSFDFAWARCHDQMVNLVIESGGDTEDCVVALVKQKQEMIKRIISLENIAPRRIMVGEKTFIWHCPDELVPER